MAPESSEDEWEEVAESQDLNDEDVKPPENVEVELELPALQKKKRKADREREEIETCIRRAAKRYSKELQIGMHKVHLLCLLHLGMRLNRFCNSEELQARAYSLLPVKFTEIKPKDVSVMFLTRLIQTVTGTFTMNWIESLLGNGLIRIDRLEKLLIRCMEKRKLSFRLDLILIFVLILRAMGIPTRLVMSLQPVSVKILTDKQKELQELKKNGNSKVKSLKATARKRKAEKKSDDLPQVDGASDVRTRVTRSRTNKNKNASGIHSKKTKNTKKKQVKVEEENISRKKVKSEAEKIKLNPKVILDKKEISPTKTKSDHPEVKIENGNLERKDQNSNDETPLGKPLSQTKLNRRLRTSARKRISKPSPADDSSDDDDFQPVKSSDSESDFETKPKKVSPKRRKRTSTNKENVVLDKKQPPKGNVTAQKQKSDPKKSLITDGQYYDEWLELYSEQEKKWICVDIFRCAVNHPEMMEKYATPPVHYVVAFDNDDAVKDITPRYSSKWLTETRKLRVGIVDKDWWKSTLSPYKTQILSRDDAENRQMQEALLAQPIPNTITAFKNHPLFALRRHLLKYEAIYPPDVPAVGLIRGEEIFPRSAIYTLHTRDKWLQEARCVRDGEEPYKMVASMWINMKLKQDMATLSLPLFGIWQTETYVPPVAKDGKVPRNQYGNVDLFKSCMMPVGCVHLRLSGLQRVARKLNIDVAQAMTGFESNGGYPHPVLDGFIVCKEHEEVLVAAWQEDQKHAAEREREKREQRIYGNWKLIIKGLLAYERVKRKYAVAKDHKSPKKGKGTAISTESATAWQAKRLEAAKSKGRGRGRKKKDDNLFPFEMDDS